MSRPRISVCMIAQNEAERIGRALESVRWADEIVVVDGGSEDDTVAIAESKGARVFVHPWPGDFGVQIGRAIESATGDWVLRLDADEVVTEELARQVREVCARADAADAYRVRRRNYFLGKWIRHGGWWPDPQIRLVRRSRIDVRGSVHETIYTKGDSRDLTGALEHDTHPTVHASVERMQRYSDLTAQIRARTRIVRPMHLFAHPFAAFLRKYVLQSGWRDGTHGFLIAVIHAMVNFTVYAKVWEMQREETRG